MAHGSFAPRHVGSSLTRDQTCVSPASSPLSHQRGPRSASFSCSRSFSLYTKLRLKRKRFLWRRDNRVLCISLIFYSGRGRRRMYSSMVEIPSAQLSSVTQSCLTLCDPMNCSPPGLPVHHQLPEFTQTHVHRVGDAIQPSHPLSSPSPPAPNPSQHLSLFQ